MKAKASDVALLGRSGICLGKSRVGLVPGAYLNAKRSERSGFCSYPRIAGAAFALLATLLTLAAVAGHAAADERIGPVSPSFLQQLGPGGLASPSGVAVSKKEGGDVYVVDRNFNQRVSQFHSNGDFVRAFGWGIVPDAATATGNLIIGSTSVTNVVTTSGSFFHGVGGIGDTVTGTGIPPETQITSIGAEELKLSNAATTSGTGVSLTVAAGTGNVSTNEVQKLAVEAASGTYELIFFSPNPGGSPQFTAPINATATHEEVQSALESLSNIGSGSISVTGGPGDEGGTHPYLIEFKEKFTDTNVREMQATEVSLSGGSAEATISTPQQGGGALETCTTSCLGESIDPYEFDRDSSYGQGTNPGQLRYSTEIAIDNDLTSESYGDVYVVDQRNFRIEKFSPSGEFLLIFGGEVNKTRVNEREEEEANSEPVTVTEAEESVCTAANLAGGDLCGRGVPGSGPSHFYAENLESETGGYPFSWFFDGNQSIAVGPGGKVYVGDYGRIQEFNPEGEFSGEFKLTDAEPQFVTSLAVNPSGNIFERSAVYSQAENPLLSQVPGVREWSPAHVLLHTFDTQAGSEPVHIALDEEGDVFVTDNNQNNFQFRAFKPAGTLYAVFTSDQIAPFCDSCRTSVGGIAVGGAGKLYATAEKPSGPHIAVIPAPLSGPPTVQEERVSDIEPTTATLHGLVNPRGYDTEARFEYLTDQQFQLDGEEFGAGTEQTAFEDLGSINQQDPVLTPISGLTAATSYHYRLDAVNHCNESNPAEECVTHGAGEIFETLSPVSIRDFTTETVGPELVNFRAELNPNGQASTYTIRYGTNTSDDCEQGNTCAFESNLHISNEFEKVSQKGHEGVTFTGLKPNTEYHYQLEVENGYGSFVTPDRTFTTENSEAEERAAESCPNTSLREENNSLALFDCRAYEQVSEHFKEGGNTGEFIAAPSGERAGYNSFGAFDEAVENPLGIPYITHRTETGWVSHALEGRPATPNYDPFTLENSLTPDLGHWLMAEHENINPTGKEKSGFWSSGSIDGTYVAKAGPIIEPVEGGARGECFVCVKSVSSDGSRAFISTGARLLPAPTDPRPDDDSETEEKPYSTGIVPPESTRIYEVAAIDSANPTMRLVAEVPVGLTDLEGNENGGCFMDVGLIHHSGESRLNNEAGTTVFYTAPIERAAGFGCGEGNPNPYGLFARTGDAPPVQLNAPPSQCSTPNPCATAGARQPLYDSASADGRRVWFTTAQPLVNEDQDNTNDLYMAKLTADGELEELVLASAGKATATHPTPGIGADVGEDGIDGSSPLNNVNQGVVKISTDGTHAAFESPAVLTEEPNALDQSAVRHANNLYVYDATSGQTKFVAELCSGAQRSGSEPGPEPVSNHFIGPEESVPDPSCPASLDAAFIDPSGGSGDISLWAQGGGAAGGEAAQITPSGTVLLFSSVSRLTNDDLDSSPDLYRYDFETGELNRVSIGRRGNDGNGNGPEPAFLPGFTGGGFLGGITPKLLSSEDATRAISNDGSTIIFKTAAPLVSHDTNGGKVKSCESREPLEEIKTGCDIYEWEAQGHGTCHEADGCVSLVSSGVVPLGEKTAIIDSSGRNIFFRTSRGLVPSDNDGVEDIYDARVEGGFHTPHPQPPCGSPERCRNPEGGPPSPAVSTSHFIAPPQHLKCGKGRHRVKKHGQVRCVPNRRPRHHHRRKHRRSARHLGVGR